MARRSNKTPTQIRVEIETKLNAAKAREARALAIDNPMIQKVQEVYDSYSADIAAISRQLKGPQSFENRRQGFVLRIREIEAGEALTLAQDGHYRNVRDYLKARLAELAEVVASGESVSQDAINSTMENVPTADFPKLYDAFELAQSNRKAFTAARGGKTEDTKALEA